MSEDEKIVFGIRILFWATLIMGIVVLISEI